MELQVKFENDGRTLYGVLHQPAASGKEPQAGERVGIVFLSGWTGYRIGPHRMFVNAARRLSGRGCWCLRFDFRGRGDSEGRHSDATIGSMISDAGRAVEFLARNAPVDRLVLIGTCSGGKVAVGSALSDSRIDRLVLWSGELVGRKQSVDRELRRSAFVFRDYLRKLTSAATWRKLVSFKVNFRMVGKAVFGHVGRRRKSAKEDVESRLPDRLRAFKGKVLFIYGSNDPESAEAMSEYGRMCGEAGIAHKFHVVQGANHSYYSVGWENEVLSVTEAWLFPS